MNALAGVKHIAPYKRGGLGRTGQGLGKRVRELKSELRGRRWGEEPSFERQREVGSGANSGEIGRKRKWGEEKRDVVKEGDKGGVDRGQGGSGTSSAGPKKRLGKKQRQRAKLAEEAMKANGSQPQQSHDIPESRPPVNAPPVNVSTETEGETKKKRRKKKKTVEGA